MRASYDSKHTFGASRARSSRPHAHTSVHSDFSIQNCRHAPDVPLRILAVDITRPLRRPAVMASVMRPRGLLRGRPHRNPWLEGFSACHGADWLPRCVAEDLLAIIRPNTFLSGCCNCWAGNLTRWHRRFKTLRAEATWGAGWVGSLGATS